jgi:hypothetical protein
LTAHFIWWYSVGVDWRIAFRVSATLFGIGLSLMVIGLIGSAFASNDPQQMILESHYIGVQQVMHLVKTLDATDIYITAGSGLATVGSYIQRKRNGQ